MSAVLSFQRLLIFPRYMIQPEPDAGQGIPGLEHLSVTSPDGPVEGWFLPGYGVGPSKPGPAVIFAHGNAELIDHWPVMLDEYRRMGISVLLPEYRGYGRAPGSPSQAAITEDFEKFHNLLISRADVDRMRIVLHGRSIGGGAVCALAATRPPAALILQSTFTSLTSMARRWFMPGFLVLDPFDNMEVISRLTCPIIIIHGRRDQTIPFDHARQLHAAAGRSTLVAYDASHNDCPPDWNIFWQDIRRFLCQARIIN